MEQALSSDLERVSSSMSNEGLIISIQLLSNDSSLGDAYVRVPEGEIARDAVQAAYATLTADQRKRLVVSMAGDEIDMESSFEANGIEDGARLEVFIFILCFSCACGTVTAVAEMCVCLALLCTGLSPEEGLGGGGDQGYGGAQPSPYGGRPDVLRRV